MQRKSGCCVAYYGLTINGTEGRFRYLKTYAKPGCLIDDSAICSITHCLHPNVLLCACKGGLHQTRLRIKQDLKGNFRTESGMIQAVPASDNICDLATNIPAELNVKDFHNATMQND
jgi:hypothetical protein